MKLKVGFAGARWLGINCLKELIQLPNVQVTSVCVPTNQEKVWWVDVNDENEVRQMGFTITPWKEWVNLKFDLVFSVLHGKIFKQDHLENSRLGIINLHPAPLPEYRGCNSYSHAIMNGAKEYGVSLHFIDEGIDTGPIINQTLFEIKPTDTAFSLYQRSQVIALNLFKKTLPSIIKAAENNQNIIAVEQNESKANYYSRTSLENKEIDLNWNQEKIKRFVRGLDFPPFEPAFIMVNGKKIHVNI